MACLFRAEARNMLFFLYQHYIFTEIQLQMLWFIYHKSRGASDDSILNDPEVPEYCKFRNFCDNFIFTNSAKIHICDIKNSLQGRDLPISVNGRVISPIREDMRSFAKIKPSRKFPNLLYTEMRHNMISHADAVSLGLLMSEFMMSVFMMSVFMISV